MVGHCCYFIHYTPRRLPTQIRPDISLHRHRRSRSARIIHQLGLVPSYRVTRSKFKIITVNPAHSYSNLQARCSNASQTNNRM